MHEDLDGRRVAIWVLGGVIVALSVVTLVLAYATGMVTTLGHASANENFGGVARGRFGWFNRIGIATFYAPQGWQFYVDYEVEAGAGSLRLWLHEPWVPIDRKISQIKRLGGKGSGRVVFDIPHSSVYSFDYEGSVLGGPANRTGYDVNYSITWGIQRR